jgi:hypothetical protein
MGGMRFTIPLSVAVLLLTGCATSASKPAAHREVPPSIRVVLVTGEVGQGVAMGQVDLDRVLELVVQEIRAQHPQVFAAQPRPGGRDTKLTVTFTNYVRGSATARLLVGSGQMKIAANAQFADAGTDAPVGTYVVQKESYLGGVIGASTSIEDVERGFAKSVAAIFNEKR